MFVCQSQISTGWLQSEHVTKLVVDVAADYNQRFVMAAMKAIC